MLWQAKLLWNCSAKMRHARVEKINVVYSNNGWNVRIVAKYNFLIPVRAPSLPAQPATSPSLTKSPLTITSCLTVHLDQAPSHYHHCSLQTPDITVWPGWSTVQCCAGLVCAALLRPADWRRPGCCCPHQLRPAAPPARTSPHSCRSLPGVSWPSWSGAAEYYLNICINVASIIMVEILNVLIQRVLLDIW